MQRILLFSASTTGSDDIAMRNLAEALRQLAPEATIKTVDGIEEGGRFDYLLRPTFSFLRDLRPGPWKVSEFESAIASVNLHTAATRVQEALDQWQPDLVVATSPVYGALLAKIFCEGRTPDFTLVALVTEPGSELSWSLFPADFYIVIHDEAKRQMLTGGALPEKIKTFGYPVRLCAPETKTRTERPLKGVGVYRILYLINCARQKAPKLLERMLRHSDWEITAVIEDDADLADTVAKLAKDSSGHLEVLQKMDHLPLLLRSHDVVVSRAATEIVHEAVAANCPLIVPKAGARHERLLITQLKQANAGALAEKPRAVVDWMERAFREDGALLGLWRKNLTTFSGEGGTQGLAQFLLEAAAGKSEGAYLHILPGPHRVSKPGREEVPAPHKSLLLCDLHTHTTWSDGKLTLRELVDFYGERGFDCLCVTDHLCDPQRLLGKLVNLTGLVLPPDKVGDYFAAIEREKKRARAKYDLILMTGLEFNKDGYTAKTSTHLLGIDLKMPIHPSLGLKELIHEIHAQGGLAVASHPHEVKGHWGKNTLYLWENLDEFAPLIDAWEVANRDDIFNPVGLKKLPFIANSDFHKPKHIHSWKTLLYCEKDPEAIKQCICVNRDVSLTLYRDHRFGADEAREKPALENGETARAAKKRA